MLKDCTQSRENSHKASILVPFWTKWGENPTVLLLFPVTKTTTRCKPKEMSNNPQFHLQITLVLAFQFTPERRRDDSAQSLCDSLTAFVLKETLWLSGVYSVCEKLLSLPSWQRVAIRTRPASCLLSTFPLTSCLRDSSYPLSGRKEKKPPKNVVPIYSVSVTPRSCHLHS